MRKYLSPTNLIGLIFSFLCTTSYSNISTNTLSLFERNLPRKFLISGISLEASPNAIDSSCFANMKRINAKWVAIIPFAFSRPGQTGIQYNSQHQWWGEREEGIVTCIQLAHKQNMKVMLKPQLWIGGGLYTGHFKCETDSAWNEWENNYLKYILHNATLAQKTGAELFCIGTEMDNAVKLRPAFWSNLIDSVKKIYKGDLTYAANWGCFKEFSSWEKLNYIGIDAYFPISNASSPTVDELVEGWQPHFKEIEEFTAQKNKQVVFTEYGYRSIDKCAHEPWLSNNVAPLNMQAQNNAYEALYRQFVPRSWFAGGFLWKWHVNDRNAGGLLNSNYTPQNKPVESTIKKWYN
ncbi:MAG: glycoside hydrolase family 113 [Ferruginibacter sp.]